MLPIYDNKNKVHQKIAYFVKIKEMQHLNNKGVLNLEIGEWT